MPRDQALVSSLAGIITRPNDPSQIPYFNVDLLALRLLLSRETATLQGAAGDERFDHGDLAIGQDTLHVHIRLTRDGSRKDAELAPDPNDLAAIYIAAGGNGTISGIHGADAKVELGSTGDALGIALGGHGYQGRSGSIPPRPDHGSMGGKGGYAKVIAGSACSTYANTGDGGTGGNGSPGAAAQAAFPGPAPGPGFRPIWWALRVLTSFIGVVPIPEPPGHRG